MTRTEENSTGLADIKQLGLFAAIGSLSYVFWIVGGMEMIERLAFYGVKAVATLYAKEPVKTGGLGVDLNTFGNLLMTWAFVQCFVPIFTGGLSDRYGYKESIFASTIVKILGYLLMAWFPTYWGFFAGAIVLAIGTAIFKPGIQGTLVKATNRQNSSVAWGIFYQTVNIGGFLGPLVAGLLRKMEWRYVFYACAAIIALNFLMLLTYRELGKEERLELARKRREEGIEQESLVVESLRELRKPHVAVYLAIFSGFWFMFNSLFDVLPAHIDDWVDTTDIVKSVFPSGKSTNPIINFFVITNPEGTRIQPEGMLNLNAGLIMLVCFIVAGLSGKMRATTSMVIGTLLSAFALMMSGYSALGWISLAAIGIFSIGEMLSSPKFSEFIGNFAPHDKKAMYLGFSQIPLAIGWTLEGKLGPMLYEEYASKDRFSREAIVARVESGQLPAPPPGLLPDFAAALAKSDASLNVAAIETGWRANTKELVNKIPQGEAFSWLVKLTGGDEAALTRELYASHNVGVVWYIMGGIGVISAAAIYIYGIWILKLQHTI